MNNPDTSKPRRRRGSRRSPWSSLRRRGESAGAGLEQGSLFAYLLFLILFPLAMGGQELWAQPLALGCGGLILALWLLATTLQGRPVFRWQWSYLFFLVPLAYAGLQAWPAAGTVLALSPETLKAWTTSHDLGMDAVAPSLSLSPVETWRQARFFLLLGLFYFLGLNLCRRRRDIFLLAGACIAAALVNALVGFYPEFTGSQPWYWYLGDASSDIVCGTFLNRNHFACLMTMGILTTLGLLFAFLTRNGHRKRHSGNAGAPLAGNGQELAEHWNQASEAPRQVLPVVLPLLFVFFILVVGQVLSLSRGGLLTMLPMAMAFFLWWLYRGSRFQRKRHIIACLTVLVGAGFIAFYEIAGRIGERYALLMQGREQLTLEGRSLVWNDLLPMLKTWWLTGVGSGAFGNVSPSFESGWALDRLAMHAHNDWLEALVEFGLPVAGTLILAGLVWLAVLGRRLGRQADSRLRWLGLGTLMAIVAVLLHELVDYSLQSPGATLVFVALLVLLARCGASGASVGVSVGESAATGGSLGIPEVPRPSFKLGILRPHGRSNGTDNSPLTLALILALALTLFALTGAYAWPRVAFGIKAAEFRNLTSEAELQNRQLGEREFRYFISLADALLAGQPDDLEILRQRAVWRQRLAVQLVNRLPELPAAVVSASIGEIRTLLSTARDDMRLVSSHYPTNGYYQLFYAQLSAQCAAGIATPADEARIEALYDLAHRNFPTLAGVTRTCAVRYWQTYCRMREREEAQRHKGTEAQSGRPAPQAPGNGSEGNSLGMPSPSSASGGGLGTGPRTQDPGLSSQNNSPTPTPTPTPAPQAPSALQALRDKALATWREAVSQDPAAIAEALPLIWQVEPDVAGLRQLTPERLVSQEALFAFLMDQQRFAEALATLQTMERLNQTRPTIEDVKHLPLAEIYRLDRRSRAEVDRMIQEQTLIALGLMEDWPARARRLAAYQQALDEITRQSLQQLLADSRSGDLHRREMTLQTLLQRNPGALAPRVPLAEALFILGKTEEATATLMPLIYQEAPVPRSLLEPALAMLRKWAPPPPPDEFSRQAFLRLALSIRLAETAKGSTPQERAAWLAELAAMEKLALQNPHNVWIQRHLIPFYAGRVHELDGQPELAVAAYRHCLEISPNNLFAQTRLARCGKDEAQRHKGTEAQSGSQAPQAPENGSTGISLGAPSPSSASRAEQGTGLRTQDPGPSGQAKSGSPISNPQSPIPAPQAPEGGIQNLLTPTLTPTPAPQALSRYGSSLALVGVSSSQAKIGRTGTVQVTQTWLCTGDVDRDYAIVTRYRQGDQILFSDRFALVALATAEAPMVSWRVGELIPLTRTITPISMAARARNRLESGKIDAEVVLQPLTPGHTPPAANPPARIPLFVVGSQ